jgi:hypothetical protein
MRQFERGREWWGLQDDGTWVKWDPEALQWDPHPGPPPEGLRETEGDGPAQDPTGEPASSRARSRIWPSRSEAGRIVGSFATDQLVLGIFVLVVVIVVVVVVFFLNPFF